MLRPVLSAPCSSQTFQKVVKQGVASSQLRMLFSSSELSLDVPLSNVPEQKGDSLRTPMQIKTSTLNNGIHVASIEADVPKSSIGLFVKGGARYENANNLGASHFLKFLAYSRTQTRSPVKVVRDMELTVGDFNVTNSRENIIYSAELLNSNISTFLPLLRDSLNPKVHEYIVRDFKDFVKLETQQAQADANTSFIETLHAEAFRNVGLGNPVHCPSYRIPLIGPDTLTTYMGERYQPKNLTFVGCGVRHEDFEALIKKHFDNNFTTSSSSTSSSSPSSSPSKYVGGDVRVPSNDITRVALVFEGASESDADRFAFRVLSSLMGGAPRDSPHHDGPGRGLCSRLYQNVLTKADFIKGTASINVSYSDSGLWGVYAEAARGNADKVVNLLATELSKLGSCGDGELHRAKNHAKASLLREVERDVAMVQHVGRQLSATGKVTSLAETLKSIDAITLTDLSKVAKRVLKSDITLVCTGDVTNVPLIKDVQAKLISK